MTPAFVGVDVGTGSARAAVFDEHGKMLARASHPIALWKNEKEHFEQSSNDIWRAVCLSAREAVNLCSQTVNIKGIGFAATCSLVAIGSSGEPVTVSESGVAEQNVILWMDHRAQTQAEAINKSDSDVLHYVGGRISPEMQLPKLLWLRQHLPHSWKEIRHFFDLPDYLTWKATGSATRSTCSLVCKWTYLGHEERWDERFFERIGLKEFVDDGFRRIGADVMRLGEKVGVLTTEAALDLGLPLGTAVATSVIDAHAGGIGLLGAQTDLERERPIDFNRRLALIGGTSSCHMAISAAPNFVPGIWGPYFSALLPGYWLSEGGQSATGALIDHVIYSSALGNELSSEASKKGSTVYEALNDTLRFMAARSRQPIALLTADIHVFPDFHGNRSPRADSSLLGMISGLRISDTAEDLARLYLATIQAIAYGTRHIVEVLNSNGFSINAIFACGGGTKNQVFLGQHADAVGMPIVLGEEEEAVPLGAAICGSVAAGHYPDLSSAMTAMSRPRRIIEPANADIREYHDRKYRVFKRLYDDQLAYRKLMT